jgi:hypothetical protein
MVSKHSNERSHAINRDLRTRLALDLNLDARARCAQGVGVSDHVDAAIGSRWRDPKHVIAHSSQERCDQILEVVRRHLGEIGAYVNPGELLGLLECAGRLALDDRVAGLVIRVDRRRLLVFPRSVEPFASRWNASGSDKLE